MSVSLEGLAAQVHRQAVETAVRRVAPGLGVNAEQLLDSRSFADAVRSLDPASLGFGDGVQAAIRAAAATDPRFRAEGTPTTTAPGQGMERQWTDEDVDKASAAELQEAMSKGLLTDLGAGPIRGRR